MTTEGSELAAVVQAVRDEVAPGADPVFLAAVVAAEEAHPDDRAAAVRDIEAALAVSLARLDVG